MTSRCVLFCWPGHTLYGICHTLYHLVLYSVYQSMTHLVCNLVYKVCHSRVVPGSLFGLLVEAMGIPRVSVGQDTDWGIRPREGLLYAWA
jgi:hypothetical protein